MTWPAFLRRFKTLFTRQKPSAPLDDSRQLGAWGEDVAAGFLEKRGFKILARNYRRAGVKGEIDLIAWDRDTLVFVEVKTRRSEDVRVAESAVDWSKRRTLIRMARVYRRKARAGQVYYRFDVVSVYPGQGGEPKVKYFPDAFRERRGPL